MDTKLKQSWEDLKINLLQTMEKRRSTENTFPHTMGVNTSKEELDKIAAGLLEKTELTKSKSEDIELILLASPDFNTFVFLISLIFHERGVSMGESKVKSELLITMLKVLSK